MIKDLNSETISRNDLRILVEQKKWKMFINNIKVIFYFFQFKSCHKFVKFYRLMISVSEHEYFETNFPKPQ